MAWWQMNPTQRAPRGNAWRPPILAPRERANPRMMARPPKRVVASWQGDEVPGGLGSMRQFTKMSVPDGGGGESPVIDYGDMGGNGATPAPPLQVTYPGPIADYGYGPTTGDYDTGTVPGPPNSVYDPVAPVQGVPYFLDNGTGGGFSYTNPDHETSDGSGGGGGGSNPWAPYAGGQYVGTGGTYGPMPGAGGDQPAPGAGGVGGVGGGGTGPQPSKGTGIGPYLPQVPAPSAPRGGGGGGGGGGGFLWDKSEQVSPRSQWEETIRQFQMQQALREFIEKGQMGLGYDQLAQRADEFGMTNRLNYDQLAQRGLEHSQNIGLNYRQLAENARQAQMRYDLDSLNSERNYTAGRDDAQWLRGFRTDELNIHRDAQNAALAENARQANQLDAYRGNTLAEQMRQANMENDYRGNTLAEQIRQANQLDAYRNTALQQQVATADADRASRDRGEAYAAFGRRMQARNALGV